MVLAVVIWYLQWLYGTCSSYMVLAVVIWYCYVCYMVLFLLLMTCYHYIILLFIYTCMSSFHITYTKCNEKHCCDIILYITL